MVLTARRTVELFHLAFVRALFADLADRRLVAIKGGINLRFFLQSVRFSEDLDLDVVTIAKGTLENRIDRLLKSPALLSPLRARGIVVKDVSKPKQTDTVQKWKVGLASADATLDERTKIEFSRRDEMADTKFESPDPELLKAHSMPTFYATHYPAPLAVRQKIHALAGRAVTQPRDVFDLHVLLARSDAPTSLDDEAVAWIDPAISNAAELTYDQYTSLVVAYLDPDHAGLYDSREAWERMQLDVITRLEALK